MNALSKAMLADNLVIEHGFSKKDAKLFVDEFFEEIRLALEKGDHVKLSGFGNFILRDKSERPGRNPKTGAVIPVTQRRVVTFKLGTKVKKDMRGHD